MPCCSVALTGAGRADVGCPPGALGGHGPHITASDAALLLLLLLLLLRALIAVSGMICCRRWGGSGAG